MTHTAGEQLALWHPMFGDFLPHFIYRHLYLHSSPDLFLKGWPADADKKHMETIRQLQPGEVYLNHKGHICITPEVRGACPTTYLALSIDGYDVSFLSYQLMSEHIFMVCAFTDEEYRQQGLFRRLFSRMTAAAPTHPINGIFLNRDLSEFVGRYNDRCRAA